MLYLTKPHPYQYTDYKDYRMEIVYAFEQIAFVFKDIPGYLGEAPCCGHYVEKWVTKKRNYLNKLRIKLGEVYLLKDDRKRHIKKDVIHKEIAGIYFTEIEEDPEVGYGRSDAEPAVKALLPYKEFIFEIIDAQKRIDKQEAEGFFINALVKSCINKYMNNKYIRGEKTIEEVRSTCERWTKEEPSPHPRNTSPIRKYHMLDYYLSGKVLIKMLKTYKDFGVQDDE